MREPEYLEFDNKQQNFLVGLGWEENPQGSGFFKRQHDLDLCCCLMRDDFNLVDFITPSDPKASDYRFEVLHTGDHKTGDSPGEDEELHLNLRKLNAEVCYVVFLVKAKKGTALKDVSGANCVFMDGATYKKFLSLALDPGRRGAGDDAQYVAAILRRWTGKTLDGDLWTLVPVDEYLQCKGETGWDFFDIKEIVEGKYKA